MWDARCETTQRRPKPTPGRDSPVGSGAAGEPPKCGDILLRSVPWHLAAGADNVVCAGLFSAGTKLTQHILWSPIPEYPDRVYVAEEQ